MQVTPPYSTFASIYDHVMTHVDYRRWANFVLQSSFPDRLPKTMLDLACGTGKIFSYFPATIKKCGLDISEEMIKAGKNIYPRADYSIGDLRNFSLKKDFELITCFHDSLNYLLKDEELISHLKSVSRHMNKKSFYLFDLSSERNLTNNFHGKTYKEKAGDTFLHWENYYDKKKKEIVSTLIFTIQTENGSEEIKEVHTQKYYSPEEVDKFCKTAGLNLIKIGSDYKEWHLKKNCSLINFMAVKI